MNKRSNWVLGFATLLAGIPAGFAIAQQDQEPDLVQPEVVEAPTFATEDPPGPPTPPPVESPSTGVSESVNVLGDGPLPPQLVERCEKDPNAETSCDLVMAIDAGEIEPGTYSDSELEQALIEAGYEGSF